jgi:hypothetical protein
LPKGSLRIEFFGSRVILWRQTSRRGCFGGGLLQTLRESIPAHACLQARTSAKLNGGPAKGQARNLLKSAGAPERIAMDFQIRPGMVDLELALVEISA